MYGCSPGLTIAVAIDVSRGRAPSSTELVLITSPLHFSLCWYWYHWYCSPPSFVSFTLGTYFYLLLLLFGMTLSNTFTNPNPSVSVASVTAPTTTTTTTTTTFHPQSYTTTSHGHGMNVNGVNGGGMTSVNVNGVNVNPTTTVTSFRPRQMQLSTPNIFANTALRRGKWTAVSYYNCYS